MSENKSLVLPIFNGEDKAFQVWWTKFRAFATAKGVIKALVGREADLPKNEGVVLDPSTDQDAIKAKERNSLAMAYLLSAFKAEADISLAYETMDDDWPGGVAYKVVENLLEIYQPKDNVTEVEVYERLLSVKMKPKEDPKTLFEQVASIQNWYNTSAKKIPKEQVIAVILKAAPKEYASILTSEQEIRGSTLQLSNLRAVMSKYYRSVHKKSDSEEENELTLTQIKFKGTCNRCGKQGHKAVDCWDDPKNAEKRPQWLKDKMSEVTAVTTSRELQL